MAQRNLYKDKGHKHFMSLDDLKAENVGAAHVDERRRIYDPSKLLEGLEGPIWFPHNLIVLNKEGLELGNHYHDYQEVYFTPTGGLTFRLCDIGTKESARYELNPGDRLFIPSETAHAVIGRKDAILLGFGNVEFDPKRLIAYNDEIREVLESLK